jgi:hypothetical protein
MEAYIPKKVLAAFWQTEEKHAKDEEQRRMHIEEENKSLSPEDQKEYVPDYRGAFLTYVIPHSKKLKREKTFLDRFCNKAEDEIEAYKETFENTPKEGYRILLENHDYYKGELQILSPEGFKFNMPVQKVTRLMREINISKGGYLQGEFVFGWPVYNDHMCLIPYQSKSYDKSVVYTQLIDSPGVVNFIPGEVYMKRHNYGNLEPYYYMGQESLTSVSNVTDHSDYRTTRKSLFTVKEHIFRRADIIESDDFIGGQYGWETYKSPKNFLSAPVDYKKHPVDIPKQVTAYKDYRYPCRKMKAVHVKEYPSGFKAFISKNKDENFYSNRYPSFNSSDLFLKLKENVFLLFRGSNGYNTLYNPQTLQLDGDVHVYTIDVTTSSLIQEQRPMQDIPLKYGILANYSKMPTAEFHKLPWVAVEIEMENGSVISPTKF